MKPTRISRASGRHILRGIMFTISVLIAACDVSGPARLVDKHASTVLPQILQSGHPRRWVAIDLPMGSAPTDVSAGPDQTVWAADPSFGRIVQINMGGGITEFTVPGAREIVTGSDHDLYVMNGTASILRVTQAGQVTTFPLRGAGNGVTLGPDGNVWFTESVPIGQTVASVGKITPLGQVSEYQVLTPNTSTFGITSGNDGNVWFTEYEACTIGKVDPTTGLIFEYGLPSQGCYPAGIASASDGSLWFTTNVDYIGKFLTSGTYAGSIQTQLWAPLSPHAIRSDQKGHIWFVGASQSQANWYVCSLSEGGVVKSHAVPWNGSGLNSLVAGPDGNLWAADPRLGEVDIFVTRVISVVPRSLSLTIGQSATLTVSETRYSGRWTAKSQNVNVATVAGGLHSNEFVVTGVGIGQTSVTVGDTKGNSFSVKVAVD